MKHRTNQAITAITLALAKSVISADESANKERPDKVGVFQKMMDPHEYVRAAGIEITPLGTSSSSNSSSNSSSKSGSSSSGSGSSSKSGSGSSSKSGSSSSSSGSKSGSSSSGSKSGSSSKTSSSGSSGSKSGSSGSSKSGSSSKSSSGSGSSKSGSSSKSSSGSGSSKSGSSSKSSSGSGSSKTSSGSSSSSNSKVGSPTQFPTPAPQDVPVPAPSKSPTMDPSRGPTTAPVPSPSAAPSFPCNLDVNTRREMILDVLSVQNDVTPAAEILTVGTSANLAFEWVVGQDELYLCPDDPKIIQRYVIAKLYFQTSGDQWINCSRAVENGPDPVCAPQETSPEGTLQGNNWLDSSQECDWAFIRCRPDTCITHIEVDQNNVSGNLIEEIDWLPFLQVYTMDGDPNELTGTIPTEFGNLPDLRILDLDENALTGTIPEEIYTGAPLLQQLDLDTNQLTGTISASLANLTSLNFFQLFSNPISGTFPSAELAGLTELTTVGLYAMDLTGVVSQEVCDLRDFNLNFLWSDCGGNPAQVVCDCCDFCFEG